MHFLHLVLVSAGDEDEALQEVECALDPFNGEVYDWYIIGGRWNGFLKGKNILRYDEDPDFFRSTLRDCKRNQDRQFIELVNCFNGATVTESQIGDIHPVIGLPIVNKQAVAEENTRHNQHFSKVWEKVLASKEVPRLEGNDAMLGYYLKRLGNLLNGFYNSSSGFLDTEQDTCLPNPDGEFTKDNYLVVVDIHN